MVMLLAVPAVRVRFAIPSSNGIFRWLVLDLAATGSETHPLRFDAEIGQQRDNDCDTRRYARQPMLNLVVEVRSDACLQRRIDRGEQIAELVDDAGERAARIRGRKLIEMGGMTPHAPWTMNCIRKAPIASRTGLPERAQSGTIGNDRSAAATIARRRPIRSERDPKVKPPRIAPML